MTAYIPLLVTSSDTHKGKRWLISNPPNHRDKHAMKRRFLCMSCHCIAANLNDHCKIRFNHWIILNSWIIWYISLSIFNNVEGPKQIYGDNHGAVFLASRDSDNLGNLRISYSTSSFNKLIENLSQIVTFIPFDSLVSVSLYISL